MVTYTLNTTANDKILAYLRKNGKHAVLTVLNMSREPVSFRISDEALSGAYTDVFSNSERDFSQDSNFILEPGGYAVFQK